MSEQKMADGAPAAEQLGWRLGVQAYTFNRFSFFEAVDKTASLGLNVIEAYPGQALTAEMPDVIFNHESPQEIRDEVKQKLAAAGLQLACYGVVRLGEDEAACRAVFEFAKDMGVETVVSEPENDALKLVDDLAEEYDLTVAIHNHPKPSTYWSPDTVREACEGLSPRVGACADTGHWMRSGLDPVESIRKLRGRIISLHMKDLNTTGPDAHDVPWGTGAGKVDDVLAELLDQGVEAVFSIEYEYHWETSLPEVAECVRYMNEAAKRLAGT